MSSSFLSSSFSSLRWWSSWSTICAASPTVWLRLYIWLNRYWIEATIPGTWPADVSVVRRAKATTTPTTSSVKTRILLVSSASVVFSSTVTDRCVADRSRSSSLSRANVRAATTLAALPTTSALLLISLSLWRLSNSVASRRAPELPTSAAPYAARTRESTAPRRQSCRPKVRTMAATPITWGTMLVDTRYSSLVSLVCIDSILENSTAPLTAECSRW